MSLDRPERIPGQQPDEWSAATRAEFDATVSISKTRPLHLPAVIAHHPTFLAPYLVWAKAVALEGVLDPRHASILALRAARNCSSEFEWGVHVERATHGGLLTAAEVEALRGAAAGSWTDLERALIAAADELARDGTVNGPTWDVLAEEFEPAALVEVCLVVGHYTMLSMISNTSGVRGEPDWDRL